MTVLAPNVPSKSSNSGESGTAYVIVLMVMFILTVTGLALTLTSNAEMLLSSSERTSETAFYAADAGISFAVAKTLHNETGATSVALHNGFLSPPPAEQAAGLADPGDEYEPEHIRFEDQVAVTPLVPILDSPCQMCPINQGSRYYEINFAVSSSAVRAGSRVDGTGAQEIAIATAIIDAMVEIQPRPRDPQTLLIAQSEIAKIRY